MTATTTPFDTTPGTSERYFRDLASCDVLDAHEERRLAREIVALKRRYWRALLSHPPFVHAVARRIGSSGVGDAVDGTLLAEATNGARALRDRSTRAHRERFDASITALADAVAGVDVDGDVADGVLADLESLAAGEPRVGLGVKRAPTGSRPFEAYLGRCRLSSQALWTVKQRFARANLRLVVMLAQRFRARQRMSLLDLVQEGNIGLMKAIDRYDPERGCRFSTYAAWWIRHMITRALTDRGREVRIPVHMVDLRRKIRRKTTELEYELGRDPTLEEVATRVGEPLEKLESMATLILERGPSLSQPIGDGEGRAWMDVLEDHDLELADVAIESQLLVAGVQDALERLPAMERDVLERRFGLHGREPTTLREIGERYSLSRERIRQIQEGALAKLRIDLDHRGLA